MSEHKHIFLPDKLISVACNKPYKIIRECRLCGYKETLGLSGNIQKHKFTTHNNRSRCIYCGKEQNTNIFSTQKNKQKHNKFSKHLIINYSFIILLFIAILISFLFINNHTEIIEESNPASSNEIILSESSAFEYTSIPATESTSMLITTEPTVEATTCEAIETPYVFQNITTETLTTDYIITTNAIDETVITTIEESLATETIITTEETTSYKAPTESLPENTTPIESTIFVPTVPAPRQGFIYLGEEIFEYISDYNIMIICDELHIYTSTPDKKIEEGLWPSSDSFICDIQYSNNEAIYVFTQF